MKRKAAVWLEAIMYIGISLVAMIIIISTFNPILEQMKSKSGIDQALEMMNDISSKVKELGLQGKGARREINYDLKFGFIDLNPDFIKKLNKTQCLSSGLSLAGGDNIVWFSNDVNYEYVETANSTVLQRGDLYINFSRSPEVGRYKMSMTMDIQNVVICYDSASPDPPYNGKVIGYLENIGKNGTSPVYFLHID